MSPTCELIPTEKNKRYPYEQYFVGKKDILKRRNGNGLNCWSGAESLESYTGRFIRDTMNGVGEYKWRYRRPAGVFVTYEGHFLGNNLHGYGVMSYPDGRVFNGHFSNNFRWGPGIESHTCLREDVGLWSGTQLVRLAWRPSVPSVAIDLMTNNVGKLYADSHRIILASSIKKIGEINNAVELLKQYGCDPLSATENWTRLYPKHCTDLDSALCHVEAFEHGYYKGKKSVLEEVTCLPQKEERLEIQNSEENILDNEFYYAWNNNPKIVHMMKSCYQNKAQRKETIDMEAILSGPRTLFKDAGQHELDCRTLLMASYLGHKTIVTQLVNESQVNPNVTDLQGNFAVMYAACGNQADIIHFLVEAGANIDEVNDACCTPLTVALLKYACLVHNITANNMVQAILPPLIKPAPLVSEQKVFEWNIRRDILSPSLPSLTKTTSKILKANQKYTSVKDLTKNSKKQETVSNNKLKINNSNFLESFTEENQVYQDINNEYNTIVTNLFLHPQLTPITHLFEIRNMVKDIDLNEVDQKKVPERNLKKVASKTLKNKMKPSHEAMVKNSEQDELGSIDSAQKLKIDMLSRAMLTILQLLSDGANPRLVRCPQPALLIATIAGSSDLVHHLINYGADFNESFPQIYNYTALDVAISRDFCNESLALTKILLECGAGAKHRLQYDESNLQDCDVSLTPGPTLLHVVLARKLENDNEEEIRQAMLELLLKYRCDPLLQFKGISAVDMALSMNVNIFNIFIKCPRTNLNAIINENNQTVLCKIFTIPFCKTIPLEDRLQLITNLLLFGADPFIECQNGEEKYKNLFVYAKKVYGEIENSQVKAISSVKGANLKAKKTTPPKKSEKLTVKSSGKLAADDVGDFKQTFDFTTECARMLYIRWLQAKLAKGLIKIVHSYNHRHWNVILREHKNKKATSLWLTAARCLEIWNILKSTRRRMYNDRRTLKLTLCIVQYYFRNPEECLSCGYITTQEKASVENDVGAILNEQKIDPNISQDMTLSKRYVMPELAVRADKKFNVCFECMLPFGDEKIECCFCDLIAFCTYECMRLNIDRSYCHPCSELIKAKYFNIPHESLGSPVSDIIKS